MADLEDELRRLSDHPPAPPAPLDEIRRRAMSRQRRRHALAAAVVTVLAIGGVAMVAKRSADQAVNTIGQLPNSHDESTAPTNLAAMDPRSAVLRLAEIAEAQPSLATGEDPVVHTRAVYVQPSAPGDSSGGQQHQFETWILGNGRIRRRSDTGGRVLPWGAQDWEWQDVPANAVSDAKAPPIDRAPAGGFAATSQSIGADNQIVDARTGEKYPLPAVGRVFDGIVAANPDAAIRAGWLRELADVPGIRLEPDLIDRTGRHGLGLTATVEGVPGHPFEYTVIIDPTTTIALALQTRPVIPPPASTTSNDAVPLATETDYYVEAVPAAPPATVHFS
jgi:hypothetical protein